MGLPIDVPGGVRVTGLEQQQVPSSISAGTPVIKGIGGSAGKATGPARIILSPRDFHKFRKGDVLVAPTTSPAWTPLFILAKALVADAGGILSHGAIVSREYRIPAVMGTRNATEVLIDGELITVDGDRGVVYVSDGRESGTLEHSKIEARKR
jgi:pyruvate,water dikinase